MTKPETIPVVYVGRHGAPTINSRVLTFGDEVDMPSDYAHAGIVGDPDAQVAKWGERRFLPGTLAEHEDIAASLEADLAAAKQALHDARVKEYARYGKVYLSPEQRAALQKQGEQITAGGARA